MAVWIEQAASYAIKPTIAWHVYWHEPLGDGRRWRTNCGKGAKGKRRAENKAARVSALIEAGCILDAEMRFSHPHRRESDSHCRDCGIPTADPSHGIDEYYMVHDRIWRKAGMTDHGMLCIGCLETRLNRRLTRSDFPNAAVHRYGSPRLMERING